MNARRVGRVAALWRYPVKSMAGEPVDAIDVSWDGLAGDGRSRPAESADVHGLRERARSPDERGSMTTSVQRSAVVHTSILAPPHETAAFLGDVSRWKTWAPWVRSAIRTSAREWTIESDTGAMFVRFAEPNELGVLDHHVTLASGLTAFNSMRVLANGTGTELVMVLFRQPAASLAEFERDVQAVRDDVARIRRAVEASVGALGDATAS